MILLIYLLVVITHGLLRVDYSFRGIFIYGYRRGSNYTSILYIHYGFKDLFLLRVSNGKVLDILFVPIRYNYLTNLQRVKGRYISFTDNYKLFLYPYRFDIYLSGLVRYYINKPLSINKLRLRANNAHHDISQCMSAEEFTKYREKRIIY